MDAVLNSFAVKEGHCQYSLGVQSISRYCNERGHDVRLVSSRPDDIEENVNGILSSGASLVGFSSNYVTEPFVMEMVKKLKEKGIFTVIGGPSVTYSSKTSRIRQSEADLFVRGDGEKAFYEILEKGPEAFLKKRVNIPGVLTKQDSNDEIASVDLTSLPSVFPVGFQTDHVYFETVRGCAFNCIFCAHPGQKNQFREFPMERVAREVDYLQEKQFRAVYVTDPVLGGSKERSKAVLNLLKKLKGSFITAEYRPEYLDDEVIDLLNDAGIGWLELGLQTTNPSLGYFRRNASSVFDKLKELSKRKIKYSLDLIAGIPGDSFESFKESLRFAVEEAKPSSLKVFPLRVYEGTRLQEMADDKGWVYDLETRIIKKSHTFDETEFLKWMRLAGVAMHLYRFLEANDWFANESRFRSLSFFTGFSDRHGEIPEEYDENWMKEIWREENERQC